MNNVERFVHLAREKDELEWEAFATDDPEERDMLEDQVFELESRLSWLWEELTQEEREEVEELL